MRTPQLHLSPLEAAVTGIWSSEEWRAHHALLTGGRMGPLTGACSDERHEDCSGRAQPGNKFCSCLVCHIQVPVMEQPAANSQPGKET